jgi:hypothetical protein
LTYLNGINRRKQSKRDGFRTKVDNLDSIIRSHLVHLTYQPPTLLSRNRSALVTNQSALVFSQNKLTLTTRQQCKHRAYEQFRVPHANFRSQIMDEPKPGSNNNKRMAVRPKLNGLVKLVIGWRDFVPERNRFFTGSVRAQLVLATQSFRRIPRRHSGTAVFSASQPADPRRRWRSSSPTPPAPHGGTRTPASPCSRALRAGNAPRPHLRCSN